MQASGVMALDDKGVSTGTAAAGARFRAVTWRAFVAILAQGIHGEESMCNAALRRNKE